jgi:hypothetical protein
VSVDDEDRFGAELTKEESLLMGRQAEELKRNARHLRYNNEYIDRKLQRLKLLEKTENEDLDKRLRNNLDYVPKKTSPKNIFGDSYKPIDIFSMLKKY